MKCTAGSAKSSAPMPTGKPHRSASRFDLENDSNRRSRRYLTAETAGYSAWVTMSSTCFVYCVICEASVSAPIDAAQKERAAMTRGTCHMSTPLVLPTNNGHEKDAYS